MSATTTLPTLHRTIVVDGQAPIHGGFGRNGRPYTIYEIVTRTPTLDDQGKPCALRAFGLLAVGVPIDCELEPYVGANGTTWTVKPKDRSQIRRSASNAPRVAPAPQAQAPTPGPSLPIGFDARLSAVEDRITQLQQEIEARMDALKHLLTDPTNQSSEG